jgi:hypothetical protein
MHEMKRIAQFVMLAAVTSACCGPKVDPQTKPSAEATQQASRDDTPSPWESKLGQVITVEGTAVNAKLGALVDTGSETLWIDGMHSWPEDAWDKRVKVTGRVIERSDLPVFVQKEGEPMMQGIPVPAGTDIEKASHRFLLSEVQWAIK